jgi:hypothetical protein
MRVIINYISQLIKYRSVLCKLSRSDYYKLEMICDDVNKRISNPEQHITPDIIATEVLCTFIDDSYADSTKRIVNLIMPELRYIRRR